MVCDVREEETASEADVVSGNGIEGRTRRVEVDDDEVDEGGVSLMRWWWVYWCLKVEDIEKRYTVWTTYSKISVLF
ncbi:hypothetical protein MTR_5g033850 [Medicago truncatula]|uniref:Uncharacterized protein n=1 Tax=Medicago truncatula TaxID=3880 RepID=G7K071_MEDTR|nr:hypothetical protein MTR_5g033850 [Medicago truncatula]